MTCVIMHNMIIESERANPAIQNQSFEHQSPLADIDHEQVPANFGAFLAMQNEIEDEQMHFQLQADLVAHLWSRRGQQ